MNINTVISANGCSVNFSLFLAVLAKSDLHWEMHRAQLHALDLLTYMNSDSTVVVKSKNPLNIEMPVLKNLTHTLMGIDIRVNNKYPRSLIRLMWGDREIARLESLSVPCTMDYNGPDFEADRKSEIEKFRKLTY